MKKSEFIESFVINGVGMNPNKNIVLTNWEKDILNITEQNPNINKIIILTDRKSGCTSFAKWLHWLDNDSVKTYLISNSLEYSKHIKSLRVYNNVIKPGFSNIDWLNILSKTSSLDNLDYNPLSEIIGCNEKLHFGVMIDNYFNKELIDRVLELKPTLFTLTISKPENNDIWSNKEFNNWLDLMSLKSDTYIYKNLNAHKELQDSVSFLR